MCTKVVGVYIQEFLSLFKTLCAVSTSDTYQLRTPSLLQSFHNGNYVRLLSHLLVEFPFITSSNPLLHYSFYMNTITKNFTLPKIEFMFLSPAGILLNIILDKNI